MIPFSGGGGASWRFAGGFKWQKKIPEFPANPAKPAPARENTFWMLGSLLTIEVMAICCSFIESTEMPCAACVKPRTSPESSLERNHLGIWKKTYTVATRSRREAKNVAKRCRRTPLRLQS